MERGLTELDRVGLLSLVAAELHVHPNATPTAPSTPDAQHAAGPRLLPLCGRAGDRLPFRTRGKRVDRTTWLERPGEPLCS